MHFLVEYDFLHLQNRLTFQNNYKVCISPGYMQLLHAILRPWLQKDYLSLLANLLLIILGLLITKKTISRVDDSYAVLLLR